jgi:hypothetical protein
VKDREIEMDNGWVDTNSIPLGELHKQGYSVAGFLDKGVPKYVLYRADTGTFKRVHEFDSAEELNNMIKLLLPPGGE